ncbi:MAG: sigma 54-interacting transcriptional regulator [Planctomycetes bacterium]|nr:sigma 54-interacting transcriptional regulator [Planctomycetota bacterium]
MPRRTETRAPLQPDFGDRYASIREVGSGERSTVFRAFDTWRGHDVALRHEPSVLARDALALRAGLRHPSMPMVLGLARCRGGEVCLVEEFVATDPLERVAQTSESSMQSFARHLLGLLSYLHDHGIVHRDIKPANIGHENVGATGLPVLLDFGFAERVDAATTRRGSLGTVAPEVLAGVADVRQADLYSLGVTMLTMLHGVEPDPEWSLDARRLRPWIDRSPASLRALLEGLCASRRNRFRSASEAIRSLPRASLATTSWTPVRSWPIPRAAYALVEACAVWLERSASTLCIHGAEGSGRHAFADAVAAVHSARTGDSERGVFVASVERVDSASFARAWQVHAMRPVIIVTANDCVRAAWSAACLDAGVVRTVEVPSISESDLACLEAWLPFAQPVDHRAVIARTLGHRASIASDLFGTHEAPTQEVGDIELYVALRTSPVDASEFDAQGGVDGPMNDRIAEAVLQRKIERDRSGKYRVPNRVRAQRILESAGSARVRAMHAIAKLHADRDVAFHAAASGDLDALPRCLEDLDDAVKLGDSELAEVRLAELVGHCGSDAVARARSFPRLARSLGRKARLDVVERVLGASSLSTPVIDALRAFVACERGDTQTATRLAKAALERDPALGALAHLDYARSLQFESRWDEALDRVDRALDVTENAIERAEVQRVRALVLFRIGRGEEAIRIVTDALASLQDDDSRARAVDEAAFDGLRLGLMQNLAMMLRHFGKLAEAATLFEQAASGFDAIGDVRSAAIVRINSAIARQDAGEIARSLDLREKALRAADLAGLARVREIARAGVGISLALMGAHADAFHQLDRAAQELESQSMPREAFAARIHAVAARTAVAGNPLASTFDELVREGLDRGFVPEAALALRAGLEFGCAASIDGSALLAMLRAANRSVRDDIRISLHARRIKNGQHIRRSMAALERLERGGLPRSRLLASEKILIHADPSERRRRLAYALRRARRSDSPFDRVRIALRAIAISKHPELYAPLVERDLTNLESLWPSSREDELLKTWHEQVATLRSLTTEVASKPKKAALARLVPVLRLNRMILDGASSDAERYRAIVREAMDLAGAHRGMLLVHRAGEQRVRIGLARGDDGSFVAADVDYSQSLVDEVLDHGKPVVTVNALADPAWRHAQSVMEFQLASIACVPIEAGDERLGALYLDNPFEEGCFAEDALEALEVLATQVSLCFAASRQRERVASLNSELSSLVDRQAEMLESKERELARVQSDRRFLYQSEGVATVMKAVRRFAATSLPVHVFGETGTGKELIARKVHELSSRRDGPFITENCSAIAAELLESELFGHVAGAFTGATSDTTGLLRAADGGTLFLDEIGDMPLALQARLLRVLEGDPVRPVGSDKSIPVDVRIVTATNRDLAALVEQGAFREDLYYRIVVARIVIPPLRERIADIRVLATHFVRLHGNAETSIDSAAMAALEAHKWPGNVRELENAMRNAVVMARDDVIRVTDLAIAGTSRQRSGSDLPTINLKELERLAIVQSLRETGGNRAHAARNLGLSRSAIFKKIREMGIS